MINTWLLHTYIAFDWCRQPQGSLVEGNAKLTGLAKVVS